MHFLAVLAFAIAYPLMAEIHVCIVCCEPRLIQMKHVYLVIS